MEKADYELSERMVSYWTNFAKTGNPNGVGLPDGNLVLRWINIYKS